MSIVPIAASLRRVPRLRLGAQVTLCCSSDKILRRIRSIAPYALLIIGAVFCVRLWKQLEWAAFVAAFRRAGPCVVLLFLAPAVSNFVHMLGWRALLSRAVRPRLGRGFRIFVAAQAGNEFGFGLLGEAVKIGAFPPESRSEAARAVVLDNASSLVAIVAVAATLASLLGRDISRVNFGFHVGAIGIVFMVILPYGAIAMLRLGKTLPRATTGFLTAFVAHYVGKLWLLAELALALALISAASLRSSATLALASMIGSTIGAPVPGQVGVVEAALSASANFAQLSLSTVLTVSVLRRIRSLLWILLGLLFFSRLDVRKGIAHREVLPH